MIKSTKAMNSQEQEEFINACETALRDGSFKRVTFKKRGKGEGKAKFELVLGGKRKFVKSIDKLTGGEVTVELDIPALLKQFRGAGIAPFGAAMLSTDSYDFHYAENRKMEPRLYRAKATMKGVSQTHNKQKQYVLEKSRPYLKGLGVASEKGEIVKKHYGKFRQIANFVEIIDRDIGEFVTAHNLPISILDLGCGKGYLTFATYDYVASRSKHQPKGIGIDIKANVIELCNNLAANIEFNGLEFINAKIQPQKPAEVDILIALHACDTATDDALSLGLRSNMKYLFCAPCCQAEIAQQIDKSNQSFGLINDFALMKRRQADIITDTCRAYLLSALGYEVKFLEFTALEHTSKNVMLVGKQSSTVDRTKAYADYLALKKAYGFKRHSLEENIKDLLIEAGHKL